MQKIKLTLLTILCIIITGQVKASTLNSLDTKVYLDENGNGHVSETWNYTIDEGTENYHSFGQLQDRQITDFSVSMDGKTYTNIGTWNVDATKEEKSYKNGINYTADGLELCHGIEYGTHTYNVNYTIKNLVWTYDDNQILYFTFLPQNMTTPPEEYQLTIYGDKQYSDLKYSSYGFKSTNNIENGKIIFKSNGNLQSDEYVVALIGFPLGTFNTEISKQGTYNDIAKSALEGAKQNKTNNLILPLLTFFIVFALVFVISKIKNGLIKYDYTNYKIPKKVNNFRDIPFDKNIILAYFTGIKEHILKEEHLIGMFLLKWLKEKKIMMIPTEKSSVFDFNKNDNYYLDLTNLANPANTIEDRLMNYLLQASDINKHLTPNQFKKWCRDNYQKINILLTETKEESQKELINNGYIEKTQNEKGRTIYALTEKLQDETIKLKGLKQFLNDMTLIDEKKAIEVFMWDEYLIFAEGFGIAEKVSKQFQQFHPTEYNATNYNNAILLSTFSTNSYNAAISAMSAASSGGSFSGGGTSSGGFSGGGGGIR